MVDDDVDVVVVVEAVNDDKLIVAPSDVTVTVTLVSIYFMTTVSVYNTDDESPINSANCANTSDAVRTSLVSGPIPNRTIILPDTNDNNKIREGFNPIINDKSLTNCVSNASRSLVSAAIVA